MCPHENITSVQKPLNLKPDLSYDYLFSKVFDLTRHIDVSICLFENLRFHAVHSDVFLKVDVSKMFHFRDPFQGLSFQRDFV